MMAQCSTVAPSSLRSFGPFRSISTSSQNNVSCPYSAALCSGVSLLLVPCTDELWALAEQRPGHVEVTHGGRDMESRGFESAFWRVRSSWMR
ncbi:hypothetical protein B296_00008900 [Ensete ventricosum]|uniref:Uncharacterized protein n=1 Tax=Ensete ventricosum TaxID=4639 RepID=A0A426YFM4_ENSVE|nr:hypothetical protein B296_00008900 [Ensete ventricosum]